LSLDRRITEPLALRSCASGRSLPAGEARLLVSAIDGSDVAGMPARAGVEQMTENARKLGGLALRGMTFQQRGRMLRSLASVARSG